MVEADLERAEERAETGESYVQYLFLKNTRVVVVFSPFINKLIKFSDFHGFRF